jgi:hypothetical protein
MMRFRFASFVPVEEKALICQVLSQGLSESQWILHNKSPGKAFYCLETPIRPIFVKAHIFSYWTQRIGKIFWRTKEEKEFRNYLALREQGILCPEPLGTAREYKGLFIRRSFLLLEYLPNTCPFRLLLIRGAPYLDQLLDKLFDFLSLLQEKGVIHEDLQWNNLLVSSTPSDPKFYLIDALHVRWVRVPQGRTFWRTLAWFVHFLILEEAPQEVIEGFMNRMYRLGLENPRDRLWVLEKAQCIGEKSHDRG